MTWQEIHDRNDALEGETRDVLERWCAKAGHPCYCNWTTGPAPVDTRRIGIEMARLFGALQERSISAHVRAQHLAKTIDAYSAHSEDWEDCPASPCTEDRAIVSGGGAK